MLEPEPEQLVEVQPDENTPVPAVVPGSPGLRRCTDPSPPTSSPPVFAINEHTIDMLESVSRRIIASRPNSNDSPLDHHLRIGSVFAAHDQLEEISFYRRSIEAQCAVGIPPSPVLLAFHQDFVTHADCLLNHVIPPGGSAPADDEEPEAPSSPPAAATVSPSPSSPAPRASPIRDGTVPPSPEEAVYDSAYSHIPDDVASTLVDDAE